MPSMLMSSSTSEALMSSAASALETGPACSEKLARCEISICAMFFIGTNLLDRILCGSHGNRSLKRPVDDRFDDGSVGERQAVSMDGNTRGPHRRGHDDVLDGTKW